jgi:hypothetical protein
MIVFFVALGKKFSLQRTQKAKEDTFDEAVAVHQLV